MIPAQPAAFRWIGTGVFGGIPVPIILTLLVFIVGWLFLSRTKFGAQIYLMGDKPSAAQLAGVPIERMTVLVYAISGFFAALAGLVLVARLDSPQPNIGIGLELDAIAAAVLGGSSLAGGIGSIPGTLAGAFIIGILSNGLNLLEVPSYNQQVVKGMVFIAAVMLDYFIKQRKSTPAAKPVEE